MCCAAVGSALDQTTSIMFYDSSIEAPFGDLDYRVYYPADATDETYVIHVSRGGNGRGDDRGQLLSYVETYVQDGYKPDQFGISQDPIGYSGIGATAVFVIVGEEEKDINGPGRFMRDDWRLQVFEAMSAEAPRFQALVMGDNTDHIDVAGRNPEIQQYNFANSLALFDTYVREKDRSADIGKLSRPDSNQIQLTVK